MALFATLIESEEEDFVENDSFSGSLMNLLVRITGANSIRLGSDTEVEVVELSFNITTKIRLDPDILSAWFTTQDREDTSEVGLDAHEKFTGKTHKEDFPLFYLLIDYIHHEGRIGDFSRTGLLYIIEAASGSGPLEQWIVESDLATLMATGLGALYSQLSRKLVIDHPYDELPAILALSDYQHPRTTMEIVSSSSADFQMHMDTFLSHLVFWQDVLNHCKSIEVKQTLLEHFQVIFLQQLLYPSLLESSDVDGGSSVAVLTYLRRILEALDHPDMIHLILHYLLALPNSVPPQSGSKASISAARKRKSMDLATLMKTQIEPSTPDLYNLVDLIQGSLRSSNEQTISVTLQLVSVILRRHHRYGVTTLLWTSQVQTASQRPIGSHELAMSSLLNLASSIGGSDDFDTVYENHIKDCMTAVESHPCSLALITPQSAGITSRFPGSQASIPGAPRDLRTHTLSPDDPMLKTLLAILATFFTNAIETNLSLTGTIVDLATCGYMRIDGWLLPDPSKYEYDDEVLDPVIVTTDEMEIHELTQLQAMKRAKRTPKRTEAQITAVLAQLKQLVDQVLAYKTEIPRFEELLQQRREAFQAAPSVTPTPLPAAAPNENESRSRSPPRRSALDSLAQRIREELGTPSRSRSPRDRNEKGFGTPTTVRDILGMPRRDSSQSQSSRAFSPSPLGDDIGGDERFRSDSVRDSQAAAFAAIDQSILTRKVGQAKNKDEIGAIPFPSLSSDSNSERSEQSGWGRGQGRGQGNEQGLDGQCDSILSPGDEMEMEENGDGEEKMVSVNHVLTNVIVLQEFLLELAALVQVRAGLFGEVRFV